MTLLGQHPVRCKIIVDDKCLEQVQNFKYLACEISYENGRQSTKTSKICSNIGNSKQQF
jgi:deoxyribose-phosphate aldolase